MHLEKYPAMQFNQQERKDSSMNTPKLSLCIGRYFKQPPEEALGLIADTGFDAVSPVWSKDGLLQKTVVSAKANGLHVQSAHAPHRHCADMWSKDLTQSEAALAELLTALHDCADLSVPIMVVHSWGGFDFSEGHLDIGLKNFSQLVAEAQKLGMQIAFENLQGEQYLYALMKHFKGSSHAGFCWDSGHEHCYSPGNSLLAEFGDRLILTHLNDNLGVSNPDGTISSKDDLHYLPFDGIIDWEKKVRQLQTARRQDILNFEVKQLSKSYQAQNEAYAHWTFPEFLAKVYQRAHIIASMYLS